MKNKQETTRHDFLSLKFPILPYCEYGRGPSTKFNESCHIEKRNTKITLNFWWRDDNTISVSTFDAKEPNPRKNNISIISNVGYLSPDDINKLCEKFLK